MIKFLTFALVCVHFALAADEQPTMTPRGYEFGSVIRNLPTDGSEIKQQPSEDYKKSSDMPGTMASSYISVNTGEFDKRRFTTYTYRPSLGFEIGEQNFEGCIPTRFMSMDELLNKAKIDYKSLIILTNAPELAQLEDKIKAANLSQMVTLGFKKRANQLSDASRNVLNNLNVPYFENLDVPEKFDMGSQRLYFAFKFVFSPMADGTSVPLELRKAGDKVFQNLASLVVYEGDDRLTSYCFSIMNSKGMPSSLSRTLNSNDYPIFNGPQLRPSFTEKGLSFSGQTGSHLVAPFKFDQTKPKLPQESFFAPCIRIKAEIDKNFTNFKVTQKMITDYEKSSKIRIPRGSIVLIDTGFGQKYWTTPQKYVDNYPVLDKDAARYLVQERGAIMIGMDTLLLDKGKEKKYPTQGYLAEANVPVLLNLQIDDDLFPAPGARCVVSYLRIEDGIAAPAGVFALPGYDPLSLAMLSDPVISNRWQFGAIIKPTMEDIKIQPVIDTTIAPIDVPARMRLLATEMALTVDPDINRGVTMFTAPDTNVSPPKIMEGCVETRFIKASDAATIKAKLAKVTKDQIVLYLASDVSALTKVYAGNKMPVTIGLFSSSVTRELRAALVENGVNFFENLARPDGFSDDQVDEDAIYYGFKFIFSPLKPSRTSLPGSLTMQPPRTINMADLVVFNRAASEVVKRCAKPKTPIDVRILSQVFGSQDPVFDQVKKAVIEGGKLSFSDHFGTHFDVPYHFDPFSFDPTGLPQTFDNPECIKVKISPSDLINNTIPVSVLVKFEQELAKKQIPTKSIVFFDTDYAKKWVNHPGEYMTGFPGLSIEAAKWLVEKRNVIGIGIDSLLLDEWTNARAYRFPIHSYLSSQNIVTLVNMGSELDHMPGYGGRCVMAYLRFEKATAAQAAIFGLPDPPTSVPLEGSSEAVIVAPSVFMIAAMLALFGQF